MGRGGARDVTAETAAGAVTRGSDHGITAHVDMPPAMSPKAKPETATPPSHTTEKAFHAVVSSWFSKKFASGCVVLFPLCVTVYLCWWFLAFFDHFFSPIFKVLFGFQVFGLGFITSMCFIFLTGVFVSSWLGTWFLWLGEWVIDKLPIIGHVYGATKQISSAVNPAAENTAAFRECVIIRHPRRGEYAFAFITGQCILSGDEGDQELFTVFIPTNHIYVGDIILLGPSDIIRPNLTVREGLEIVVSCGCALPPHITSLPAALAARGAAGAHGAGYGAAGGAAGASLGAGSLGGGAGSHHGIGAGHHPHTPSPGVYGISSAPLEGRGGLFGVGGAGGAGAGQGKAGSG